MNRKSDPLSMKFEVWDAPDLVAIVQALRLDLAEQPEGWTNGTLDDFFGAMQVWLEAFPQPYLDGDGTVVDDMARILADSMLAARSGSAGTGSGGQVRSTTKGA